MSIICSREKKKKKGLEKYCFSAAAKLPEYPAQKKNAEMLIGLKMLGRGRANVVNAGEHQVRQVTFEETRS